MVAVYHCIATVCLALNLRQLQFVISHLFFDMDVLLNVAPGIRN